MGVFFIVLIILLILSFFLYVKINIQNLELSNVKKDTKSKVLLEIYLLKVIPILKIRLDNKNLLKKDSKLRIKLKKFLNKNRLNKSLSLKNFRRIKLYLEKLNFKIDIGTGEILSTTYTVPVISTIAAVILNLGNIKINNNKLYYEVNPIFNKESFFYNLHLNCIISFNLAQTIITLLTKNKIKTDFFTVSSPTQG